ncbi:hypothetical protein Q5752_001745 [Cryptotrichosporon argae]
MASPASSPGTTPNTRTVVVLGASYGGARAARVLGQDLPPGWRVVVIDRNSHMNHVYAFPRYSVLPSHAPKGFIPYTHMFKDSSSEASSSSVPSSPPTPPLTPPSGSPGLPALNHTFIQGNITSLSAHRVTFTLPCVRGSYDDLMQPSAASTLRTESVDFDYCIYALGSGMPDPVNVWGEHPNMPPGVAHEKHERGLGTKVGGVRWMERKAKQLKHAERILIVGGGALGIQFATDLKEVYPHKTVTLLHSRPRLLPLYPIEMHTEVLKGLHDVGVEVVLGERVVTWPDEPEILDGRVKVVRTDKGREFEADLVLPCTGQKAHVALMAALAPSTISPVTSRIRVRPTLQVSQGPVRPAPSRATTVERLASLSLHASCTSSSASASSSSAPTDAASTAPTSVDPAEATVTEPDEPDLSHMFAVGDCADTGAIQAGHTAYYQADLAARNVLRLIDAREAADAGRPAPAEELGTYEPSFPAIKVSTGIRRVVTSTKEGVKVSLDGVEDLQSLVMWPLFNAQDLPVDA